MNPVLLNIWGPVAIHAYGVCIAIGVFIALLLILHDRPLQKILKADDLINSLQLMIISGYVGGRLLFLFSEAQQWSDYAMLLKFWEPGLSILGCVLGIVIMMGTYIWIKKIPVLQYFDRVVIYAPIAQSFGRIGCFFAGCCHGIPCSSWWSVTYTHPDHMAPLNLSLHPAQLYSSAMLFGVFLLLYFIIQHRTKTPGVILCCYLFFTGLERFLIDFVRWDRIFLTNPSWTMFSIHQLIGLSISCCACIGIIVLLKQSKKSHGSV